MESWEKFDNKEKVEVIQRMQDYIKDHLADPITLYELAQSAGYSPWHSAKIFKEYIGKGPFEYIRSLRLSEAALELRDSNKKVIDVAVDIVFDSHEGFTRAFNREFGITPKKYQINKPPIYLFKAYSTKDRYAYACNLKCEEGEIVKMSNNFFVHVRDYPERKLILKRGITATEYFKYVEEVGCEVWGLLCSFKEALYEPVGLWLPEKLISKGTSRYVQGVEVNKDYNGVVPDGFEVINLPACEMMLFQSQPFKDEDFGKAIEQLESTIDDYDPSQQGYEWDLENSPRIQMSPQGYRGYMEGPPVKVLK